MFANHLHRACNCLSNSALTQWYPVFLVARIAQAKSEIEKYVILSDLYAMSAMLQMMADGNRELQSL
jgi:hypothetical protein